jgi:hypothetical protein
MENCDREWKTPPKTRTARKSSISTEKEPKEKKRSKSDGRFDHVPQGHLGEMKGHHATSEHEDYAAEKDETEFEDGTEWHDGGSERSEKVAGATDRPSELRQTVDAFGEEWGRVSRKRRLRLRKRL